MEIGDKRLAMATNKPAPGNTILIAQVPVKMKQEILNRANKQGTTASYVLRELVHHALETA
jgi:hypothetical protein